jgi:hypothetical protein
MPPYPELRHCMEVGNGLISDSQSKAEVKSVDEDDWAAQYQAYLDEKDTIENQESEGATATNDKKVTNEEDWAVQYAEYCIEKEKDFFASYPLQKD